MGGKSARKNLFQVDGPVVHPRLRRWQQMRSSGYSLELEVYRKWDGLTYSPAKMFVTAKRDPGDPGAIEELLWDDELNQGLVQLGVQACDEENEIVRYSLGLKSAFELVSLRHGQDWMKGLLVEFLRKYEIVSDLTKTPKLAEVLSAIRVTGTYRGAARDYALETIEAIIKTKALELTIQLNYTPQSAKNILANALAQYLDEIFHITARQVWFPNGSK